MSLADWQAVILLAVDRSRPITDIPTVQTTFARALRETLGSSPKCEEQALRKMEIRKLLFSLLCLPVFPAFCAPEKYVLKAQGIYCPAKYRESIEEIADANNDRSLKRAVGAAVMSGECGKSGVEIPVFIEDVTQEKTKHGSPYFCYVRLGEHDRSCSVAASVRTLAQIQSERTGDFDIVADNDKVLFAKCKEGGQVYVEKGADWH